jgi:hypothetical protein
MHMYMYFYVRLLTLYVANIHVHLGATTLKYKLHDYNATTLIYKVHVHLHVCMTIKVIQGTHTRTSGRDYVNL